MLSKRLLLAMACLMSMLQLYAQNPTNYIRTDLIANSPTATSIAKQGASNINMATGAVNLSLPIFNVQGNELALPISLNYTYDGFRPTQTAGWAGMGWSLNAGGVITRTIKGKVDGDSNSGNNYWDANVKAHVYHALSETYIEDEQDFFAGITQGIYDTELDVYSFNFDGYSGKFVMHGDTAFVTPKQKLRITGGPGGGFVITTENGTKYSFTATETTTNKGSAGAPYTIPTYNSSWYLTSIENVTGTEQITLSYVSDGTVNQGGAYTQTLKKIDDPSQGTSSLFSAMPTYPSKVTALRLSQIASDKFTVDFYGSAANRTDISSDSPASKALEKIVISSGGSTLKTFKLGMGYFSSNYLKLNSLTEYGSNYPDTVTSPGQKHVFEYYTGNFSVTNKVTAAVDHFGYSLGGDFSGTAIPNTLYTYGVDRSPSFEQTKSGALKKVTYPTGGSTEFEYERNVRSDGANYQTEYLSIETYRLRGGGDGSTSQLYNTTETFNIANAQNVSVTVVRTPKVAQEDGIAKNDVDDFELVHVDGGAETVIAHDRIGLEERNVGWTFGPYSVPAGTYYLRVIVDNREDRIGAAVNYTAPGTVPIEGMPVGGLRLKKVTGKPVIGQETQTLYGYVNNLGFSTGAGTSDSYSNYNYREEFYTALNTYRLVNSQMFTSMVAENSVNDHPHYYTQVSEMQVGGTDTLLTKNWFSFMGPAFGTRPIKTIQYKKSGSGYVPLAKKEYDYYLAQYRTFRNMKSQQDWKRINETGTFAPLPMEHYLPDNSETFQIEQLFTKGIRETSYEGTDSLIRNTRYDYDIAGTTNLLMERSIRPDGEQVITKYKYPESYTSSLNGAFISANVVAPAWETQSWRKNGADSVLTGASFTEYDATVFKPVKQYSLTAKGISALNNETKTTGLYNTLLADSRFEERANYSYNAKGRTIRQQLKDGVPVSYQWGYGAQENYPVAEVKNALPTEFYFENFEDNGSATVGTGHSGTKYYNGDFSVSWSIPNGRSYMLSYWYLDGSAWKYAEQAYTGATTLTQGSAIDDVAIFPKDAQLGHYAYQQGVGLSSSTDAKGMSTSYVYDVFQRLQDVKDQDGNIVKHYDYHLAGEPVGSSAPTTTISYLNFTTPYTPSGPNSADISSLVIKDGSGNTLYSYNLSQLQAGITVPQGTYTFEFTMSGMTWDPDTMLGWGTCYVLANYYTLGFIDYTMSSYVMTGVTLNTATATLNLDMYVF